MAHICCGAHQRCCNLLTSTTIATTITCVHQCACGDSGAQLGGASGALKDTRKVYIIARQHPGESQAEFICEGLLERLTDPADAVSRHLLRDATIYCVPNMNPDGTWCGAEQAVCGRPVCCSECVRMCVSMCVSMCVCNVSHFRPSLPASSLCVDLQAWSPSDKCCRRQPESGVGGALPRRRPRGGCCAEDDAGHRCVLC